MAPLFERVLVVDVETSGLDPARHEILQIGAVLWERGRAAATLDRVCRPSRPVPLPVLRLTGLDPDTLEHAESLQEGLAALEDMVAGMHGVPVCAHHAAFDLAFLSAAGSSLPARGSPVLDTVELARLLWPSGNHGLRDLVARLGGQDWEAHRAAGDAAATAWLLGAAVRRAAGATPELRETWRRLLAPVDPVLTAFLEEAAGLTRELPPDDAAEAAAVWRQAPDRGREAVVDAGAIADSATAREPEEGSPGLQAGWDRRRVTGIFERDGVLARGLPGYEWRPSQAEMAEAVAQAFERDEVAVLEAGTGTGKSLAYLVPAVAWSASEQERVVVSTHTLALQEQLLGNDLPVALAAVGVPMKVALLKGQTQYLCLRRWKEATAGELALSETERRLFARVASWLAVTGEGDRSEIPLREPEEATWSRLVIEDHACTGRRCPEYSSCFVMAARRRAAESGVVVVNHALLLSDLRAGGTVLPPHERLIIDEAHHLEDLAAEHLGDTFDRAAWQRRLSEIFRPRERSGQTLLARLASESQRLGEDDPLPAGSLACREASAAIDQLFEVLSAWATGGGGQAARDEGERMLPPQGAAAEPAWTRVEEAAEEARDALERLGAFLGAAATAIESASAASPEDSIVDEARRTSEALAEGARALGRILAREPGRVAWFETDRRRPALRAAPVYVGDVLREALFERKSTVVLTSATLSVAGRLTHFTERLGLTPLRDRTRAASVASPFWYREQALLALPTDLPQVPQTEDAAYWDRTLPFLGGLLERSGGRALILFTSHRALRQAHARLRPELEEHGIQALAQGLDGSRTRLLDALRSNPRTAIFGAASFWEGVDVPGENLQLVVLMRLPFRRPNHPLERARAEAVTARGGDAFRELSLPEAVLRFKQGFGRLIRTRDDRGSVVCLDDRLTRTAYGRAFLRSLPGASCYAGRASDVLEAVGDWLAGARSHRDFPALDADDDAV